MLCQNCNKNEATTHLKQIINGDMSEQHLCSECTKILGSGDMFYDFGSNLSEFFSSFFGDTLPAISAGNVQRCETCGSSFNDIINEGKVGCADCYGTFYEKLLPSIQRIHGKPRHIGKVSPTFGVDTDIQNQKIVAELESDIKENEVCVDALRQEMKNAIAEENFELAAELRDKIKEAEGVANK